MLDDLDGVAVGVGDPGDQQTAESLMRGCQKRGSRGREVGESAGREVGESGGRVVGP